MQLRLAVIQSMLIYSIILLLRHTQAVPRTSICVRHFEPNVASSGGLSCFRRLEGPVWHWGQISCASRREVRHEICSTHSILLQVLIPIACRTFGVPLLWSSRMDCVEVSIYRALCWEVRPCRRVQHMSSRWNNVKRVEMVSVGTVGT